MQWLGLERRISDTHGRLRQARAELAVLDEQLSTVTEEAEDARVRSLVAETPLATREYDEAKRHADALEGARQAMVARVDELQRRRDELLTHVGKHR